MVVRRASWVLVLAIASLTVLIAPTVGGSLGQTVPVDLAGTHPVSLAGLSTPASSYWSQFRFNASHSGRSPLLGPTDPGVNWSVSVPGPGGSHFESPVQAPTGVVWATSRGISGFLNGTPDGLIAGKAYRLSAFESTPAVARSGLVVAGSLKGLFVGGTPNGSTFWVAGLSPYVDAVYSSAAVNILGQSFVGDQNGKVYEVSPAGKVRWSYDTGGAVESTPALSRSGTIYVGSDSGGLYSLSSSGGLNWVFNTSKPIVSSPALTDGGNVVFGGEDSVIYDLYANGSVDWTYATGASIESSPAISADGTTYIGSTDGNLYAIWPNGTLRWAFPTGSAIYSSPAVDAAGIVYFGSTNGNVYAVGSSGRQIWSFGLGAPVYSSPAIGPGRELFVENDRGRLVALGQQSTHNTVVSFVETGLPAGTVWNVNFTGTNRSSAANHLNFSSTIGKSPALFTVAQIACGTGCRYVPSPAQGRVTLPASGPVSITFVKQYLIKMVLDLHGFKVFYSDTWCNAATHTYFSGPTTTGYGFSDWSSSNATEIVPLHPLQIATPVYVNATGVLWANY